MGDSPIAVRCRQLQFWLRILAPAGRCVISMLVIRCGHGWLGLALRQFKFVPCEIECNSSLLSWIGWLNDGEAAAGSLVLVSIVPPAAGAAAAA